MSVPTPNPQDPSFPQQGVPGQGIPDPAQQMPFGQPGAPQYYQGPPAPAPRKVPTGRRGPLTLLITGVVLLVAAVASFGLGVFSVVGQATSLESFSSNEVHQLDLEPNSIYGIYADADVSCLAVDAAEDEVPLGTVASSLRTNDHQMLLTFTTATAQLPVSLYCESVDQSPVFVGVAMSASGLGGMIGGMLFGVFAGIAGFGLTLGGIIWLVVRNKAIRNAARYQ